MSVTFPRGFRAGAAAAGLKSSGALDVCVVINDGAQPSAAAVFTSNRVAAAPVRWSQAVLEQGAVRAAVLNSGGANACTGAQGAADAQEMAELAAAEFSIRSEEVAVCSTGLIGVYLPMPKVRAGITAACAAIGDDEGAGEAAAQAIMTTDSVAKVATWHSAETDEPQWRIGGMAKGAGMLAPGLATMLVVITTDAAVDAGTAQAVLAEACALTFNRLDSDGCMSTNDTVLLLASGEAGAVEESRLRVGIHAVCRDLMLQLQRDAEGSTKDIAVSVAGAASVEDAESAARVIARSALLKCAIHGEDANWGRVLAALGTSDAVFNPDMVDVALNGVWLCRGGQAAESRDAVRWEGRAVTIDVLLHAGECASTVWTNDLTAMYVHENSAYSS